MGSARAPQAERQGSRGPSTDAGLPPHLNFSWALVICSFSLLLLVERKWGGLGGGGGGAAVLLASAPPRPEAHVYIDIGTNNGLSVLRFLGVPGVGAVFDASAPSRAGHTWHIAMVEANPFHLERLQEMERDIVEFGHTAELHAPYAISPTNGTDITFYLDNWQAGTLAATTVPGSLSSSGETLNVPTLSLQYLCEALVLGGLREED